MKAPAVFFLALTLAACSPTDNDSVKEAKEANQNAAIDEDISDFLTEAADARMMGIEQGKLAKQKATTAALRRYGERMIAEQSKLLHDLRVLAASKNIALPNELSNDKKDALEDLRENSGEAFDKKFMKMMTIDHKRDARRFDDAVDFKDRDVKQFATSYLPVVESHLEQIQALKENYESENISERGEEDDDQ